ncbi:P450 family fatty acid hydroxylase [Xylariomycetidae sp. FL0641]|nr:P450 family fatty acid hydroxylase [Xylariomycetidae sp. FL0641]
MATHGHPAIPGPRPWPILGNLPDLDLQNTVQSWLDLADTYGPIYKLRLGGNERIFLTGYELINEVCSRKDFVKVPIGVIKSQKPLTPEGLFTADDDQESWGLAHRTLVPSFGPLSVRNMLEEMHDIISQLVLRWARFGDEGPIDVTADFTRLTLDTIALCAMDYRFNSFYRDETHPFAQGFIDTLVESQKRSVRPQWLTSLMWGANQRFDETCDRLHRVAGEAISRRRKEPSSRKNLFNAMLNNSDPVTGEKLSDQIIMDNIITFLAAGHETTSGLLSFLFALLLQHPTVYEQLQKEVDTVLGTGPLTVEHLSKLPYTKACLRETLRVYPTAPGFYLTLQGDAPVLLGGKWLVHPGDTCVVLLQGLHRDPEIFGSDAKVFKPERMLEQNFKELPPNAFKPFGNGKRACIGSEFAMQEAMMTTAILIQKFDFRLANPDYEIKIKQTATLKPRDLHVYAKLRSHIESLGLQRELFHNSVARGTGHSSVSIGAVSSTSTEVGVLQPMSVYFGSNTGTCEGLADRLAKLALQRGYECTIKPLDAAVDGLASGTPVVFICSTHYEGQPPDNAAKFMEWLSAQGESSLAGVKYAVFGCGNRDWKQTYQAIPTLLAANMDKAGADAVAPRGAADAGEGDILGDFDAWQADHFWPGIDQTYGTTKADPAMLTAIEPVGVQGVEAQVEEVKALTSGEPRPKFSMTVKLPEGVAYEVGDYLEVYPRNSTADIKKLAIVLISQGVEIGDALFSSLASGYELGQPASQKQLETLIQAAGDATDKARLLETRGRPSTSVLELLETCPSISLSKPQLAALFPPMRPRLYSIASSPLADARRCKLVWSLVTQGDGITPGLSSHFLAALQPGDVLRCRVRPGTPRFRPPLDLATPLIMVCAGAGVAPFLGFIAHRAAQVSAADAALRSQVGPCLLYVGCHGPQQAAVCAAELAQTTTGMVVDVRYAYSRARHGDGGGDDFAGHVQDRVWAERDELVRLWEQQERGGAKVYVCGSRAVSQGVKEVVQRIYRDVAADRCGGRTREEVDEWWVGILRDRYAVDVF